jgi:hypothetical protein
VLIPVLAALRATTTGTDRRLKISFQHRRQAMYSTLTGAAKLE